MEASDKEETEKENNDTRCQVNWMQPSCLVWSYKSDKMKINQFVWSNEIVQKSIKYLNGLKEKEVVRC